MRRRFTLVLGLVAIAIVVAAAVVFRHHTPSKHGQVLAWGVPISIGQQIPARLGPLFEIDAVMPELYGSSALSLKRDGLTYLAVQTDRRGRVTELWGGAEGGTDANLRTFIDTNIGPGVQLEFREVHDRLEATHTLDGFDIHCWRKPPVNDDGTFDYGFEIRSRPAR